MKRFQKYLSALGIHPRYFWGDFNGFPGVSVVDFKTKQKVNL